MIANKCSSLQVRQPPKNLATHKLVTRQRRSALRAKRLSTVLIKAQEQQSNNAEKESSEEEDFEKRLAALRTAKNQTPSGQGKKAQQRKQQQQPGTSEQVEYKSTEPEEKPSYDFSGETVYFEGGPHVGDLITNVVMGATLVWIPLTIASVTRAAFVKYRFTDKRLTVTTDAPWKKEESNVAYQQVKDVQTVNRGLGLWGDMVVTLADNSKVEIRSLPQHSDLKQYILARRDALLGTAEDLDEPKWTGGKGFGQ
eukprot:TRINITY_DN5041_c0_g1_i1.p3 TRINITY_DN5041_c0_g1~~TRINITY_DN5041_c0_g1_i1.p3  ORF type:complete len:254 (+),score=40.96 TRINITY_DN5041_c0_g1_i1:111-872(+)